MEKKIILKKIPLFELLQLLEQIYGTGADFIDVLGVMKGDDDAQDEIMVSVQEKYMSKNPKMPDFFEQSVDEHFNLKTNMNDLLGLI